MPYRVDVSTKGGYVFTARSKGYEFSIDMKGEQGVTPPDCLLASVASCLGVYIRKYLEGAHMDIPGFEVSAEAEFAKEPPSRFQEVRVTIDLKGAQMDERRKAAFLEFIKNCPVHNTIKHAPEFIFTFK